MPRRCHRVLASGVPALLFSVVIAHPCEAVQINGLASPPPTPILQVPARDQVTAQAIASPASASPSVSRYMPPVHIAPASNQGNRGGRTSVASQAVFNGQSVNGRRNTTQQVSYTGRPTVMKLQDDYQNATEPARVHANETRRDIVDTVNGNRRYYGMVGANSRPPAAAAPAAAPASYPQQKIRRPGLQDHIASAIQRVSNKKSEPTEAVRYENESSEDNVSNADLDRVPQLARRGSNRASGAFRRQRSERQKTDSGVRPERFDHYDELLVRDGASDGRLSVDIRDQFNQEMDQQKRGEIAIEDDLDGPIEFAVDYQRPADHPESDHVDEEIMPTARLAAVQSPDRDYRRRVAKAARPLSRQDRSRTRGQQVSVLSRTVQDAENDMGNDFEEVPNRLRSNQSIEKIDDFDPLNDLGDGDEDLQDSGTDSSDLDDLDRDIDAELERLRERSGDDEGDEDDDSVSAPPAKDCETFRNELLGSSIRDIALDISPPASSLPGSSYPIGRSWTDRSGNVIATGAMQDLRRGYVILDSGQKIAYAKLSESDLAAVSDFWRLPTVCLLGNRGSVERNWIPQTFTWTASNVCHKTLFFENVQLERYGHSHGPFMQPVQSVAHFFTSLVTVPYQAAIHPANECQYALGYYRPGNCAPWLKDPIPISLDGLRRQALVTTGLSFIP